MSEIQVSITDQSDTSDIEHKNILESEGDRVATINKSNPNYELGNNWTQRAQNWDLQLRQAKLIDGSAQARLRNNELGSHNDGTYLARFNLDVAASFTDYLGLIARATTGLATGYAALLFNGELSLWKVGVAKLSGTAYAPSLGTDYIMEFIVSGTSLTVNVWDIAHAVLQKTLSTTDATYTTGYFEYMMGNASGFNKLMGSYYSTISPSPVTIWTAEAIGAIIDMSSAKIWVFKDGVIQVTTSTDVKFQYAVNNGALNGSWLTLTQLRLESDPTITDGTNSIKVTAQYISNGAYESKSSTVMRFNITPAVGGGGGGSLVNGGLIGI